MESNTSVVVGACISSNTANFVMANTVLTLPFHILLIKVLISDLRLNLPRHYTMLCLSVSDALQIFISSSCMTTVHVFNVTRDTGGCTASRIILFFILSVTIVVSSLSLVALSVERFVACIHSFHLHQIFTRERMIYGIAVIWIIGVICGAIAAILAGLDWEKMGKNANFVMRIIAVIFIIPTSITITIIQYRLLAFSRKKLARVRPESMFGSEAEIADMRKKQIKVAFVASIVAIAYIVCMFPMGCLSLYELVFGTLPHSPWKALVERLILVNNFADPFIYGIGIVDARKAVVRNLKRMKDFITRKSQK